MEGTRSGLPLLAASARPRAGVVLAGCAVLVAVLGAVFARQNMADRFDHAVDAPVITWFAGHHGLALWLAFPGTTKPAVALSLVIAAACLLAGRLAGALLAVAAVPVAVGLCELLIKPLVHRTYIGQVVYPSGHVAAISALAATVTVLLVAAPRPVLARALRVFVLILAYLTVAAVVVGVIAVRFHYFTDTVAGVAVGTGTVCGLALGISQFRRPAWSSPPGRPSPRAFPDPDHRLWSFRSCPCADQGSHGPDREPCGVGAAPRRAAARRRPAGARAPAARERLRTAPPAGAPGGAAAGGGGADR
jgi:membrane-associated phospholipid phosphatase